MILKNYYQILGIVRDSDQKTIRKAWRSKAQLLHPDHNPDDPASEELFKEVQEAYRILSDPFLKTRYDSGIFVNLSSSVSESSEAHHYFYVRILENEVRQFDEMAVIFTYTGRGRVFRKPSFSNFFLTGPPYVSHRMVLHEGYQLKETTFTYMVCPLVTGNLTISRAFIRIADKEFNSEPVHVQVKRNKCHFTMNSPADGRPVKLTLHYTFPGIETPFRISEQMKNHTLLIPRSRTAFYFHGIGKTMKVVFMLWGAIMLPFYFQLPVLVGGALGLLTGGLNCMIMYKLAGVRSVYKFAPRYPIANEYLDKGYNLGESLGIPLIKGNFFYDLGRLLF